MANFPHPRRAIRAPRANLWGTVSTTIQLQNGRQLWGKAVRISITGGLLELSTCLDERALVKLTVHLGSRPVRGRAAMLFPMCAKDAYLQPFRFTDLRDEERVALEAEVRRLLKHEETSGSSRPGVMGIRSRHPFLES
jgi:hypothetical protein